MNDFVNANQDNYHHYEAVEVLGDILAAMGRYDQAQIRYAALGSAPWPEYKLRAAVLEGRSLAAQGKHQEAGARFDAALAIEMDSPGADAHRLAARLGKAESQAETGNAAEAIEAIEQIIAAAEPEAIDLQARAHNVLGQCHLKAGAPKEALYAFLYVDVLCGSAAEAHAEALFQLIPLYRTLGRDEDSRLARERLLDRYPSSLWAKQLTGGASG
jgi:tetratricopeptide (TPR) repeat protein